jgi:hypothetical protein
MSIEVEFSEPKDHAPSRGTAGLQSQSQGHPTTVSGLMNATKAIGNEALIKKDIK